MKLPLPQGPVADQAYRLLMEKRCEVYTRSAGLVMEVEEALDSEDTERARGLLDDAFSRLELLLRCFSIVVFCHFFKVSPSLSSSSSVGTG